MIHRNDGCDVVLDVLDIVGIVWKQFQFICVIVVDIRHRGVFCGVSVLTTKIFGFSANDMDVIYNDDDEDDDDFKKN